MNAKEWLKRECGENAFGMAISVQEMAERLMQRYGDFREDSIRGMLKISEADVVNLKEIVKECATENKALRGKLALAITYLRDHANINIKEEAERFESECMALQSNDGPDCKGWPDLPDGGPK